MNAQEMEKVHDIRPTAHYAKRNPGLFDPLKVGLKHTILFLLNFNQPEVVPPPLKCYVRTNVTPPPTQPPSPTPQGPNNGTKHLTCIMWI